MPTYFTEAFILSLLTRFRIVSDVKALTSAVFAAGIRYKTIWDTPAWDIPGTASKITLEIKGTHGAAGINGFLVEDFDGNQFHYGTDGSIFICGENAEDLVIDFVRGWETYFNLLCDSLGLTKSDLARAIAA